MTFMIMHNLPFVRGGSLWQYRSVPLPMQLWPPHCPPMLTPEPPLIGKRFGAAHFSDVSQLSSPVKALGRSSGYIQNAPFSSYS